MRILTWNINSVRLRIDLLTRLIDETEPDVICLQETKVVDDAFPMKPLAEKGFRHSVIAGQKSYNGVAILSRLPLTGGGVKDWCGRSDCRHVFATVDGGGAGGVEVHCLYVPAGGDVPDPAVNDKFAHKLRFLDEMIAWWPAAARAGRKLVLAGDLNIAPLEHDVWSHKQLLDVVSHTPVEVAKLAALQQTLGWVDAARRFVPPEQKLYSWWSYRAKDWRAADRGRRLDHIWISPALEGGLKACAVLAGVRGWEPKPSDHVPVIVELAP